MVSPETIQTQITKMDSVGCRHVFVHICANSCVIIIREEKAVHLRVEFMERSWAEEIGERIKGGKGRVK